MTNFMLSFLKKCFGLLVPVILMVLAFSAQAQSRFIEFNPNEIVAGNNSVYESRESGNQLLAVADRWERIIQFVMVDKSGNQIDATDQIVLPPPPPTPLEKQIGNVDDMPDDKDPCWLFKKFNIPFCEMQTSLGNIALQEVEPGSLIAILSR